MKKLTFVISDIDKALSFEWLYEGLYPEFELHYILLNSRQSKLESYLKGKGASVKRLDPSGSTLKVFLRVRRALKNASPDIVHCHLRRAELLGIPAAWFIGIKKRVYTRHSSTYNHLFHRKGVLVDKMINRLATQIIAISKNVETVLMQSEGVPRKKIVLLPHGFDLSLFGNIDLVETEQLRRKYAIPAGKTVIGIIARLTWWKGFEFIIPALVKYRDSFPDAHFIFANAKGNDEEEIRKLLYDDLPEESVSEIEFEENVPALYSVFDYYVHVPIDASVEAFGQTYIESLASGVPSVFTLSGIAHEFIKDGQNALVVPHRDSDAIFEALKRLREDNALRLRIIEGGLRDSSVFTMEEHVRKLKSFYDE